MGNSLRARPPRFFLTAAAVAALSSTGCNFVSGTHDAVTEFLVDPRTNGTYFGWSEITISQDASSVKGATIKFARLEIPDDSPAEDLTFIQSIYGEMVIKDGETYLEKQPVAKKDSIPEGSLVVPLDLLYEGDLRHFFPDGHTVRIEWTGTRNPAVTIPDEGYWVDVRVRVNVE